MEPLQLSEAFSLHVERERIKPAKKILGEVLQKRDDEEKAAKLLGPKDKCVCNKNVQVTEFPLLNTGVIVCCNNVCPGCKAGVKHDNETARIVCVRCKKVVARLKPSKDKTGFRYVAGQTYHSDACPECKPNLTESQIVEKVIYMKKLGIT